MFLSILLLSSKKTERIEFTLKGEISHNCPFKLLLPRGHSRNSSFNSLLNALCPEPLFSLNMR